MSQNCHFTVDFFKLGLKQGYQLPLVTISFESILIYFNNCYFSQNMLFFFFFKETRLFACRIFTLLNLADRLLLVHLPIRVSFYFLYAGR